MASMGLMLWHIEQNMHEYAIDETSEGSIKALMNVYARLPEWIRDAIEIQELLKWKTYPGFTVNFKRGEKEAGLSITVDRKNRFRHFEIMNQVDLELGLEEKKATPEGDDYDGDADHIKHFWIDDATEFVQAHSDGISEERLTAQGAKALERMVAKEIIVICEQYKDYIAK